jgi:hypothetical protein
MAEVSPERARLDNRYWIPFLGYVAATKHNPLSLNFLENTLLYFIVGLIIRRFTSPTFIVVSFALFAASAIFEWVVFSRMKPKRFGWDRLDRQSFIWSIWQSFCFFSLGLLV